MTNTPRQAAYPFTVRTLLSGAIASWITVLIFQLGAQRLLGGDAYLRYPGVYRSPEELQAHLPVALLGSFLSAVAVVGLYGLVVRRGGVGEGLRFGLLLSAFYFFGVILTLFAQLNVGSEMIFVGGGRWVRMMLSSAVLGAVAKPQTER